MVHTEEVSRSELFARKIGSLPEAERWIKDLCDLDLAFHFDDPPDDIVDVRTGERTFTDEECSLIGQRLDEVFSFDLDPFEHLVKHTLETSENHDA